MPPDRLSSRIGRVLLLSFAALAFLASGLVGAYLLDTRDGPRTARNVEIAGRPAGDLTRAEVARVVSRIRNQVGGREIVLAMPDGPRSMLGAELGLTVDHEDMVQAALETGGGGSVSDRFRRWFRSLSTRQEVPAAYELDQERAAESIGRLDGLVVEEPTEPRLVMSLEQELTVREGEHGRVVDVDGLAQRLAANVEAGGPFGAEAALTDLPPSLDESQLRELADELNRATADGIAVRVDDETRSLGASALRIRLDVEHSEDEARPRFDLDSLQHLIEHTFRDVQLGGEDPVFDVVDDQPVLVEPGTPPMECCEDGAAKVVASAVLEGRADPVTVEPKRSDDPRLVEWAEGEGVVEKVAEFTTEHACCQARVNNIQRFADIVRGAYLRPGESLSLNEHVGQRTREKGFVPAGTILQGHLVPTVGGGVSQFATTMFNAAFFAGFDFLDYQSHSIYFSRYPYGREATISWPAPDLHFENTTGYPALIWTSYTDTSITVSIYSTQSVQVEEIGQETSPARACTRVDTHRRRTYEDGREVEDSVFATYRPSEGLDCNGNPTDRPNL